MNAQPAVWLRSNVRFSFCSGCHCLWLLVTLSPGPTMVAVAVTTPPNPCPCRYEILTPNAIPKGFMDGKQACEKMVSEGRCVCVWCVCVGGVHTVWGWGEDQDLPYHCIFSVSPPLPTDPSPRTGPQPLPRGTE